MTDLSDYSGKLEPEFRHDTFTRETLFKLLNTYAAYMIRVDGLWYETVMNKWGNEAALDCDHKIHQRAKPYEIETLSEIMNIKGNDVAALMKALQIGPWVRHVELEIDLRSDNYAIYTARSCPSVLTLEKEGNGREQSICLEACLVGARVMASHFNPNIEITTIKLPPRNSPDDICCRWEIKLEPAS
ncbi:DUF6125 family protein [Chloroflexota bacterium]